MGGSFDLISTEVLGIPGVIAMELLIGCRNRAEIEELQSC
jgi:hypothetical protein